MFLSVSPRFKSVRSFWLWSSSETLLRVRAPGAKKAPHALPKTCRPPINRFPIPSISFQGSGEAALYCARSTRAFCPSTGSGSRAESREGRALREHGDHPSGPACSYSPAPLSPFHRRVAWSILDCAHFLTHPTLSASRRAHVPGEHISIMLPPSSLVTSLGMGAD